MKFFSSTKVVINMSIVHVLYMVIITTLAKVGIQIYDFLKTIYKENLQINAKFAYFFASPLTL
jgi:hypothetical protein